MKWMEKRWEGIADKIDPVLQLLRSFAFIDICWFSPSPAFLGAGFCN